MGMQWTEEQQKVIQLRNRNILVSAAAGSGKTAVLVERILTMLTDPVHPVDIDKLLIMTFTRAAAGEMKARLSGALENALDAAPDNECLRRQSSLIHNAQITTIDGFCSYVIRNYFHLIGLDPGYRTAEEGELKLLKNDVLRGVMEKFHQEGSPEFHNLLDSYAPGKTDEAMERTVLRLFEFSQSAPWPEEWIRECGRLYEAESAEELQECAWIQYLWEDTEKQLADLEELAEANLALCRQPDGPFLYEEAACADSRLAEQLWKLCAEREFDGLVSALGTMTWEPLSRKKDGRISDWKKEQYKEKRELMKKTVKDLKERYFTVSLEEVLRTLAMCRKPMEELIALTLEFTRQYGERKRQKNLLDFSDMEHFALDILVERKEDGSLHPTEAARELSEKYEEILVDEYQDSNLVQETIMNLVAGWTKQKKNLFMVGDVKQSIYRFRLARPELFMEKFHRYTLTDSEEQRVDLSRNFRSRFQVLDSVNYIFRKIMGEDLGKVEYDKAAALYPGADYPEGGNPDFPVTEVLLIEKDGPELEDEKSALAAREAEALTIAGRIREIVGKEQIYDRSRGEYRTAQYGDVVILLRSASGWAEEFARVLEGQGIPAYTASKTGYFSAMEVVTVLNYLRICDNFRQEIPLASVLHSHFGGCTAEELAFLKTCYPDLPLYEQVERYLIQEEIPDRELKRKLQSFWEKLEDIRGRVPYTPIHQLILYLLEKSGYQDYVSALPGGEQRRANLNMLVEKAMEFEKTSYRGLFNFIRYVESLQKYQVDFGEVSLASGEQSVRIMTIHKSKGLEFPVVFVAGMGKKFNLQDVNTGILMHPDMGLGAEAVDPKLRIKTTTLPRQVMQKRLLEESLGEELRVLYVALTRAKEKLILTGTAGNLEKRIQALHSLAEREEEKLSYTMLSSARDYWSWVLPALARHRAMDSLYQEYGLGGNSASPYYGKEKEFSIVHVRPGDLITDQVEQQVKAKLRKERLESWDPEQMASPEIREELERRFSYQYPYRHLREIPVKVSVSEIKKRSWSDEEAGELYFEPDIIPLIPEFIEEKQEAYTGAERGTAYHRALECLNYGRSDTREEIREQLVQMLAERKLNQAMYDCLDDRVLYGFVKSSVGQRMKAAWEKGLLKREQPFVIRQNAGEIDPGWDVSQQVLVQGIIDAYFLEEDQLVIVDYKTDKVYPGQEHRLLELYGIQLNYYGQALERMTGRKVKEKIIYSITLQKEIPVV